MTNETQTESLEKKIKTEFNRLTTKEKWAGVGRVEDCVISKNTIIKLEGNPKRIYLIEGNYRINRGEYVIYNCLPSATKIRVYSDKFDYLCTIKHSNVPKKSNWTPNPYDMGARGYERFMDMNMPDND